MTHTLPSYLNGSWTAGQGDPLQVDDAVTGQQVARVSTEGLDLDGAVLHARQVGGVSLRAAGFQERAAMVKALAGALAERKDELYVLSAHAGSTQRDAAVDIDGAIGTAAVFASLAKAGLPDGNLLVEDDPIRLSRQGTFVGRHVLTPFRGVAIQVNAYNFPVWGMIEKLAPALIAGVPTIVKPATQTAYITERAVRIIVDAHVLPDGALQLVSGPWRGVLDHLGGQDLLSFTGSADTAAHLRTHPAVARRSVRFTAEADSLNSSVLGPDATDRTEERALFIDQLVAEMTVKAGQRCTAIRRAFVPRAWIDDVLEAIAARLQEVVVGAPGEEGVTMGALVGTAHREDVRAQVARLQDEADLVFGDPARVDVRGGDDRVGAFLSPLLLRADADASAPHSVEAFGPVSTVLPYDGTDHLVDLIARGEGSLVASLVSHDPDFVRTTVQGIAAHHGRVLVLDRDDAAESTGHGTPMPQLVHGGPGRAGGGQEEGGLRAVHHHLQRTAVQGGPGLADLLMGT